MKEISQEDLLRYLYGETSEKKTAAIEAALKKDLKLKESYEQIKSVQRSLNTLKTSPSNGTIDRIMEYAASKQSKVQTH